MCENSIKDEVLPNYGLRCCLSFCFVLLASVLLCCRSAGAAESGVCFNLAAGPSADNALEDAISYFEDPSTSRSLSDLLADRSVLWQRLPEKIPSFGFSNSAFWLKIDVCPAKGLGQSAVLEVSYPLLDHIRVLGVVEQRIVYDALSGDSLPFSQRPVKHRNFVFFLPDLPQDDLSLYIRVETKSAMQIPLQLFTPLDFFDHNQQTMMIQGLYFGIILAMVLYNAFVFVFLRELPYLLYVLFTTSYFSFQGVFQGIFQQFLFDSVWLQNHTLLIFGFMSMAFANWFAISFLKLSTKNLAISRILSGIGWISCLAAILASFFPYEIMIKLMLGLAIPGSLLIMFIGNQLWWVGYLPARIFTVAWSTLLVSFVLASFNKIGLVPRTFWTENILQIGGLLEVILLSIALAERVNEEKRQRILAEQRLSTSLEEKVEERTKELNHALEQLEEANSVLSQISHTDSLTQIANRRSFDIQLALEYKSASRGGFPLALIMIDIDHFKKFNDTYGHLVGDKVLRSVAKTLKLHAARPGDSIYRYGGEEFAVLLNNTDLAGAEFVAEKIRHAVEETVIRIHDRSFFVTISAGISIYDPKEPTGRIRTPEDLIHQADMSLYKAKEKGRNCIEALREDNS
jgi:diguanylate cyclase (GGDEF)-like protein